MLALFVNLLFIAVLVFSVSWQNRKPEAVIAELYAPPPPPAPEPKARPEPQPPPPKVEPPPEPKPAPKPPVVEKPDEREADIALQAKREAERRQQQEKAERERKEREEAQREDERREAETRRIAEEKRQAEIRQRQERDLAAMRAQAEREVRLRATQAEQQARMRAQAERETQLRAQAERESQLRAQADQESRQRAAQAAAGAARNKAQLDWIDKIRSRIRGYINLPPDIPGNPEAIFDVVQLPTGEIIEVKLRKSSGFRAYDDAVQRAILKASPLPRAVPADLFQRNLELRFRPLDQ